MIFSFVSSPTADDVNKSERNSRRVFAQAEQERDRLLTLTFRTPAEHLELENHIKNRDRNQRILNGLDGRNNAMIQALRRAQQRVNRGD